MSVSTASLDGAHVAVIRDGEVVLFATESLAVAARAAAPGHERAAAFCGRTLLVHSVDGDRTLLTVFALPKLAVVSQFEVDGATRLLATTHHYALIDRPQSAFLALCTPENAAVAPLRLPVSLTWAIGLEQAQFMTWGPRGAEIWDASTRRPTARVALDLPPGALALGVTGQHHWMWVLTADQKLQASRLSDGRTVHLPIDGAIADPVGHPATSWLVADVAGAPSAINVALRASAPVELPDGARIVIPSRAAPSDAIVLVAGGERISRVTLSTDPGRAETTSAAIAAAPSPARRPAAAPVAVTAVVAAPPPPSRPSWRDDLLAWARRVLHGTPTDPLPFLAGSSLDDLITHAALTESSARILHVLYAEWLDGRREVGVAPATLAAIGDHPDAWADALGTGALGALGLIRSELGRTRLVAAVGEHLDGRPPGVELLGAERRPLLARGVFRVPRRDGESLRACAERLVPAIGRVAICEADLEAGRLEAWLREAAVLTPIAGATAPRPTETILLAVPAGAPGAPDDPPWWE